MKRFILPPSAFILLFCAACAPVVYVTPAGSRDVLPIEAGRIVDAATASAAAMATQVAQATATDQSSRATATTARQATLDALGGRQTESALSLTQEAGRAASTVTTAVLTQAAGQNQANARDQAEFWATLRTVLVALLVVAGLAWITVQVVDRVTAIRIERLRERAAIAREAFKLLPPGHWAEWQPGDGYQVYSLPGGLDEPATIIDNWPTNPNRDFELRQAFRLHAWWGNMFGFGIRDLGPAGAQVETDPAYRKLDKAFKSAGILVERVIEREGRKVKVTTWREGMDYTTFADDLNHGRVVLTFPSGDDPPKVAFAVPTQHHGTTQATQPTQATRV